MASNALIRRPPSPLAVVPRPWSRLIPAWIVSGLVHVALLSLFLLVAVSNAAAPPETESIVIASEVVDPPVQEADLEDPFIGLGPDLAPGTESPRFEGVSVPGPENPNEAPGMEGALVAPPVDIPPPRGWLDKDGAGGSKLGPVSGKGAPGAAGGPGGELLRRSFDGRSASNRMAAAGRNGGNGRSEAAVALGQQWIVAHQASDGHWSLGAFMHSGRCNCGGRSTTDNDIAGTAFGLLPLLGAGETHKGTGKNSRYAKNVERGLSYLLSKQGRDGFFGGGALYAHGLATIAVCEAYGMTGDVRLKGPAQRALDYIASAQRDAGGWDYGPKGAGFDTSVGGWQLMAIKSGQMAGLNVNRETLSKANRWLDAASSPDGGGYAYRTGQPPSSRMTAVGLLCREYMGWGPRSPGLARGVQNLLKQPPSPANRDIYYYYYATQVLHHLGGDAWAFWNEGRSPKGDKAGMGVRDLLIDTQDQGTDPKHPHQKGSWSAAGDTIAESGGRLMSTSLALLTLEVYYRHLPLYSRDLSAGKEMEAP